MVETPLDIVLRRGCARISYPIPVIIGQDPRPPSPPQTNPPGRLEANPLTQDVGGGHGAVVAHDQQGEEGIGHRR
jgi:hypothetical protein